MDIYLQYIALILSLVLILIQDKSSAQSYRAAVVAYKPERVPSDLPLGIRTRNKERYIQYMEEVKDKADIIIFPENGITTNEINSKSKAHLDSYSIAIPDEQFINPCNSSLDGVLIGLSCGAKSSGIYIVFNVIEKSGQNEEKKFYSTDVVFDPEGRLILKCRKKYPSNGTNLDKGDQSHKCIFDAKFKNSNVKFALLFDTDLVYARENMVTDVILTSSHTNLLPLSYGLSLQVGYAVRNKVNLLTSGYTDLDNAYGGSGIYLRNGTSTVAINPDIVISQIPINENKIDVINVDIKPPRLPVPAFDIPYESISFLNNTNTSGRYLFNDVTNYCIFDLDENNIEPYRWVAFQQKSTQYMGQEVPGLIVCAIVKPEDKKNQRKIINRVSISTTLSSENVIQLLPVSLTSDLLPTNFQFEEKVNASKQTTTMTLTKADLISFGVMVVYKDASGSSSIHVFHMYTLGFMSMFVLLWSKEFYFSF